MEILKKVYFVIFIVFLFGSCDNISKEFSLKGSCDDITKRFQEIECLQIFEKLPAWDTPYLKSEGTHLLTGFKCICEDDTRSLNVYKNYFEKGDTIIKRKGELTFSIHKKDTVIVVKWECEGKVYE